VGHFAFLDADIELHGAALSSRRNQRAGLANQRWLQVLVDLEAWRVGGSLDGLGCRNR
jgi:hypothetical protein